MKYTSKDRRQEYFAKWDRYITFLESINFVTTNCDPDIQGYWKKDEHTDANGRTYFTPEICISIPISIVEVMMGQK